MIHFWYTAILVLMFAGCGPSLADLQAQRDELQRAEARLTIEVGLMVRWLEDKTPREERRTIGPVVDEIRGKEPVDKCRDRKMAEWMKVEKKRKEVEARIARMIQ